MFANSPSKAARSSANCSILETLPDAPIDIDQLLGCQRDLHLPQLTLEVIALCLQVLLPLLQLFAFTHPARCFPLPPQDPSIPAPAAFIRTRYETLASWNHANPPTGISTPEAPIHYHVFSVTNEFEVLVTR
jgi:hypothetical protein